MVKKWMKRTLALLLALSACLCLALAEGNPTATPTADAAPTPAQSAAPTEATEAPTATPAPDAEPTPTQSAEPAPEQSAEPTETAEPTTEAPVEAATPTPAPEIPMGVDDLRVQNELAQQALKNEAAFTDISLTGAAFADFYFNGVQTIQGIFSTLGLYAELPDYAKPVGGMLRLSYTASDLILAEYSSLTFYMNGTPFYSCAVYPSSSAPTVLYIAVPVELMQTGYNLLEIGAYVRLTDDDGCTDDYNGANWIRIDEVTCLRLSYDIAENAGELSVFPYPFLSLTDQTGADCAVTVSDMAQNCELEAGLMLMAGLGTEVAQQNDIQFGRISQTDRKHVIYFGLRDNTSAELLKLLGTAVPPTGAVIRRVSTEEREYLLVISNEQAALSEAARFLADDTRVSQAHSVDSFISVGEAEAFIAAARRSGLAVEGLYTIKDILGHGASFSGPFEQRVTLYLPVAEDYALSSESRFTFQIRYSENLDFDRSLMTVYWGNNIPLKSCKLTKEGASGTTVTFAVPADAVGAAGTSMTIVFDLEIKDLDCTPRQLNMPWAYLAEDSTLYLPAGESSTLSLSNRPAPFQRGSNLDNVMVVLPDAPNAGELLLAGRTLSMLGVGSSPYGTLKVCHAAEFTAVDANYHLIVIGQNGSNSLLRRLNQDLYFQMNETMDAVLSNDKIILSDSYAREVGTIQLLPSPYAQGRALLVLSAPTDESLAAVTDRISADRKRWALEKEAVLVDTHGKASAYVFTTAATVAQEEEKPTFARVVVENREPMLFLLIGMACMMLVLVAVIVVLLKIRNNKKE